MRIVSSQNAATALLCATALLLSSNNAPQHIFDSVSSLTIQSFDILFGVNQQQRNNAKI
jgi:hypothetical protein